MLNQAKKGKNQHEKKIIGDIRKKILICLYFAYLCYAENV